MISSISINKTTKQGIKSLLTYGFGLIRAHQWDNDLNACYDNPSKGEKAGKDIEEGVLNRVILEALRHSIEVDEISDAALLFDVLTRNYGQGENEDEEDEEHGRNRIMPREKITIAIQYGEERVREMIREEVGPGSIIRTDSIPRIVRTPTDAGFLELILGMMTTVKGRPLLFAA